MPGRLKPSRNSHDIRGDHTQVFSNDRQVRSSFRLTPCSVDRLKKFLPGTCAPSVLFRQWVTKRDFPISGKSAEVVKADNIHKAQAPSGNVPSTMHNRSFYEHSSGRADYPTIDRSAEK